MWWIPIANPIYFLVLYLYMSFENSHQNKMSSFKFIHQDKDKGRSFNDRNCQLNFFFRFDFVWHFLHTTNKGGGDVYLYNMFWMSMWISLMTIINTQATGRGMSLNIPHPWQKVITLAKLHNVRNRYLMRHRSFYKALYQMLGGLPSAKIENGMSYFM